jgi:hypothetical protein
MYIAYYHREPTPSLPVKYHTSLFTTPKNPNSMTTIRECMRYHIVDRVAPDDEAQGYWIFQARQAYARSTNLAGILLLGKILPSVSDKDIEGILRSVPMNRTVAENLSWRCRHWVWDALGVSFGFYQDYLPLMTSQHLIDREIIPSLPNTAEVVWNNGVSFIEGCGPITSGQGIPCCNADGKGIPSEIGPMKF